EQPCGLLRAEAQRLWKLLGRRVRQPAILEIGHRPRRLLALEHVEAHRHLAGDLHAVKQISPSPIAACMSPTANSPPGRRTGKEIRAPTVKVVVEVAAVARPARPVVICSPSVATPTTPTIGCAGNRTRSFISTQPSATLNRRQRRLHLVDQLAEPGMSVATRSRSG